MRLLHRNPILYREMRMRLRVGHVVVLAVALGGILGLALTYLSLLEMNEPEMPGVFDWARFWSRFAVVVMAIQVFCAFYMSLGSAAGSIAREKSNKTYDFLTTLPVSASDKVIGLAVGTNLHFLLIAVVLTPVALAAGIVGGLPLEGMVWFYVLIAAGFLAASLFGLALSSMATGGIVGWVIAFVFFMGDKLFLHAVTEKSFMSTLLLSTSPYATLRALLTCPGDLAPVFSPGEHHFFIWAVPWQVSPLCFLGFLAILSFLVARTKLSHPSTTPLDRRIAVGAFVVFQGLLLGFLADTLGAVEYPSEVAGVFLMMNFSLLLAWGMVSQPAFAAMMQWAGGRPGWLGRLVPESFASASSPSILPAGLMWILAVAAIWAMDLLYWGRQLSLVGMLLVAAVLGVFLLAYLSLYTVGCISSRRVGKAMGLVLVAACFVIPAIFSTLENGETLAHAAPLAVFGEIGSRYSLLLPEGDLRSGDFNYWLSLSFAVGELVVFGGLCLLALRSLAHRIPRPGGMTDRA